MIKSMRLACFYCIMKAKTTTTINVSAKSMKMKRHIHTFTHYHCKYLPVHIQYHTYIPANANGDRDYILSKGLPDVKSLLCQVTQFRKQNLVIYHLQTLMNPSTYRHTWIICTAQSDLHSITAVKSDSKVRDANEKYNFQTTNTSMKA